MLKNRHMSNLIDIIGLFASEYSLSLSRREIARRLSVNHQTALMILKRMVKDNSLIVKQQGRNLMYQLKLDDFKTIHALSLAESFSAQSALELFELKMILSQLIPLGDAVIVFGSFAKRKKKDDSDLDLVIINCSSKERVKKIIHALPREVNIHYVTWREFNTAFRTRNHLALEIRKDHLIYGNIDRVIQTYLSQ